MPDTSKGIKGIAVAVGIAAIVGGCLAPHFDRETYVATVTEKQVKRYDDDDKYLIFTKLKDGSVRVFENTDSIVEFKWNSSDLYGKMEPGKTYRIRTYGWRIPIISGYENIIGVEEAK